MATLDERYGRRAPSPRRRRLLVGGAGLALLAALAGVGWVALGNADPAVRSELVSWQIQDDGSATVRLEVTVREGVPAACQVVARAADAAVVGRRTIELPAGPDRRVPIDARIAVERPAAIAELVGCTAPDQRRPR